MAQGGDVFVLDMGEPVKIADLARHMIELSGLELQDEENPEGEIAIAVTGLRPGEKLYEELLIGDDPQPTGHPRIFRASEEFLDLASLQTHLTQIQAYAKAGDTKKITDSLRDLVVGYHPEA